MISPRLTRYLIAIDRNMTDKYWDKQLCHKGRMSFKDFRKKWGAF